MIIAGWCVITGAYFVTLLLSSWIYTAITGWPTDQHRDVSGLVLGIVMVVVPYLVGGIYAGIAATRQSAGKAALWASLIPSLAEKAFVLAIGSLFVALGGSPINWPNIFMSVRAEAIPYFTPAYLLTFPLSMLASIITATIVVRQRRRDELE